MSDNIAIVTPLKNEVRSIPKLIESINSQSIRIHTWLIIENDSTDGSKELLKDLNDILNVDNLHIINLEMENKEYELGIKYSKIVQHGFYYIEKHIGFNNIDYIGILDADCFPEKYYYTKLLNFMKKLPNIGITSGVIYFENGTKHSINTNHVRGSGRLWKMSCFLDAGYIIGMSADSLSTTKAKLKGWTSAVTQSAKLYSREAGAKVGYGYYGEASYYRGDPLIYAFLRSFKAILKFNVLFSFYFLKGYLISYISNRNRVSDDEILKYYQNRNIRDLL